MHRDLYVVACNVAMDKTFALVTDDSDSSHKHSEMIERVHAMLCVQVSDYNIARHITNVHRFQDAAVTPPYTTQQLQRYIKFARTLTPKITDAAKAVMVQEYRKLRQSDASSLSKSSYRITVRQLESMIRLSEALARLHCDDEIKPEYVIEACRLLRKSIVQVQSEDIDLQEAEQDDALNAAMDAVMEEADGSTGAAQPEHDATSAASTPQKLPQDESDDVAVEGDAQPTPKKHVSISYDKYTSIATMIIHHLRQLEDSSEEADFVGGTTDDVVNWYLETQEENLETEEQVAEEARIVRLVLYRMVHVDNVILELEDATLGGESDEDDDGDSMMARKSGEEKKKYLVVHPNYSQSN
eukprot:m.963602 g.963602  ORF g.963602 m.963602 type:complete len:356 (+) comp23896_c0_seq5:89-1156(+)